MESDNLCRDVNEIPSSGASRAPPDEISARQYCPRGDIITDCLRELLGEDPEIDAIIGLYKSPQRPRHWRISCLRFDNILTYVGENFIRFPISAIYGPNHSGKTSLMDIISYALYGVPIRSDCSQIVRGATTMMTSITIEVIGGNIQNDGDIQNGGNQNIADTPQQFVITRERTGSKTLVRFEMITAAERVMISDDLRTVGSIVERMIGPQRYLLATALAVANRGDILSMGPTDRINLFGEICGLSGHKELIRGVKAANASLVAARAEIRLPRIPSPRETLARLSAAAAADPSPGDINIVAAELAEARKNNAGLSRADFDAAVARRSMLESTEYVERPVGDPAKLRTNLDLITAGLAKFRAELDSIPVTESVDFIMTMDAIHDRTEKLAAARALIPRLEPVDDTFVNHLREEYSATGRFTYAIDCEQCVRNRTLIDGSNYVERIAAEEARLETARQKNASVEAKLLMISSIEEKIAADRNQVESAERNRLRRERLTADIDKLQVLAEKYRDELEKFRLFDIACETLPSKETIIKEIKTLPTADVWIDPAPIEEKLAAINAWITRDALRKQEIAIATADLPLADSEDKLRSINSMIDLYSKFLAVAGNPKFPAVVISRYIGVIAAAVNRITTPFGLTVNMAVGEKSLDVSIGDESHPLELASGMQRLVISTALRIAFRETFPCCKQIFVDEIGAISPENLDLFYQLPVIPLSSMEIPGCEVIYITPQGSKINNGDADDTPVTTLKKKTARKPRGARVAASDSTTVAASDSASDSTAVSASNSTAVAASDSASDSTATAANNSEANNQSTPAASNNVQRHITVTCGCGATIRESSLGAHVTTKKHQTWLAKQS